MIDNGIPPKVSSPEPSSYAPPSNAGSRSEGKGFYETLNTVGQQNQKPSSGQQAQADTQAADTQASDQDAAALADAGTDAAQADTAAGHAQSRANKAIIDIRYRGQQAAATLKADAQAAAADTGTVKDAKAEAEAENTKVKSETGTAEQLAEVIDDAMAATIKGKPGANQTKGVDAAKTEKGKAGEETALATESTGNPLDEMLTLLAAGPVQAPTEKDGGKAQAANALGDQTVDADGVASRKDLAGGIAAGLRNVADNDDDAALPQTDTDAADQAFRLVRADGKGQAVSVRNGEQAGEAQAERTSAAKDSGPTVTILDARRFLAPVSDTNAANISAAFLGDSTWVDAMRASSIDSIDAQTASGAGKVVNTLKIQMSPIELGLVTATMRLSGETLSIQLTVESPAAMHKLKEDSSAIVDALKAQGFAVDQIQISVAASAKSDTDTGSQQQQQAGGQQAAQSGGQGGGQGGSFAQRQEAERASRDTANAMGMKTDEAVATQGSQGGSDGTRPSHVYI